MATDMDAKDLALCSTEELLSHVKSEPESSDSSSSGSSSESDGEEDVKKEIDDGILTVTFFGQVDDVEPKIENDEIDSSVSASASFMEEIVSASANDSKDFEQTIFSCNTCGRNLKGLKRLQAHEARHVNKPHHNCKYCEYSHTCAQKVMLHETKHTGEKPFQCRFCSHRARYPGDISKHEKVHLPGKEFACHLCSHRTKWKKNLDTHMNTHFLDKTVQCTLCGKGFKTETNLKQHLKHIHSDEKPFSCDVCGFRAKTKWEIKNHSIYQHSTEKKFPCTHPGCNLRLKTKSDLTKHLTTHREKAELLCDLCQRKLKSKSLMRIHLLQHLESGKAHYCPYCPKVCYSRSGFRYHMYQHGNPKLHTCQVCGHIFRQKRNLENHMKVHKSSDRPFTCPLCDCTYTGLNDVLGHIGYIHCKKYTFCCEQCHKVFPQLARIKRHIERCHQDKGKGKIFAFEYNDRCAFKNDQNPNNSTTEQNLGLPLLSLENAFNDDSSLNIKDNRESEGAMEDNSPRSQRPFHSSQSSRSEPLTDKTKDGDSNSNNKLTINQTALKAPEVVKLGTYGGVGISLASKEAQIQFRVRRNTKMPESWNADPKKKVVVGRTQMGLKRRRPLLNKAGSKKRKLLCDSNVKVQETCSSSTAEIAKENDNIETVHNGAIVEGASTSSTEQGDEGHQLVSSEIINSQSPTNMAVPKAQDCNTFSSSDNAQLGKGFSEISNSCSHSTDSSSLQNPENQSSFSMTNVTESVDGCVKKSRRGRPPKNNIQSDQKWCVKFLPMKPGSQRRKRVFTLSSEQENKGDGSPSNSAVDSEKESKKGTTTTDSTNVKVISLEVFKQDMTEKAMRLGFTEKNNSDEEEDQRSQSAEKEGTSLKSLALSYVHKKKGKSTSVFSSNPFENSVPSSRRRGRPKGGLQNNKSSSLREVKISKELAKNVPDELECYLHQPSVVLRDIYPSNDTALHNLTLALTESDMCSGLVNLKLLKKETKIKKDDLRAFLNSRSYSLTDDWHLVPPERFDSLSDRDKVQVSLTAPEISTSTAASNKAVIENCADEILDLSNEPTVTSVRNLCGANEHQNECILGSSKEYVILSDINDTELANIPCSQSNKSSTIDEQRSLGENDEPKQVQNQHGCSGDHSISSGKNKAEYVELQTGRDVNAAVDNTMLNHSTAEHTKTYTNDLDVEGSVAVSKERNEDSFNEHILDMGSSEKIDSVTNTCSTNFTLHNNGNLENEAFAQYVTESCEDDFEPLEQNQHKFLEQETHKSSEQVSQTECVGVPQSVIKPCGEKKSNLELTEQVSAMEPDKQMEFVSMELSGNTAHYEPSELDPQANRSLSVNIDALSESRDILCKDTIELGPPVLERQTEMLSDISSTDEVDDTNPQSSLGDQLVANSSMSFGMNGFTESDSISLCSVSSVANSSKSYSAAVSKLKMSLSELGYELSDDWTVLKSNKVNREVRTNKGKGQMVEKRKNGTSSVEPSSSSNLLDSEDKKSDMARSKCVQKEVEEKEDTSEEAVNSASLSESGSSLKISDKRELRNARHKNKPNQAKSHEKLSEAETSSAGIDRSSSTTTPKSFKILEKMFKILCASLPEGYVARKDGLIMKKPWHSKKSIEKSQQNHNDTSGKKSREATSCSSDENSVSNKDTGLVAEKYVANKQKKTCFSVHSKIRKKEKSSFKLKQKVKSTSKSLAHSGKKPHLVRPDHIPAGFIRTKHGKIMKKPGSKPKSHVSVKDKKLSDNKTSQKQCVQAQGSGFQQKLTSNLQVHSGKKPHFVRPDLIPVGFIRTKHEKIMKKPGPKPKSPLPVKGKLNANEKQSLQILRSGFQQNNENQKTAISSQTLNSGKENSSEENEETSALVVYHSEQLPEGFVKNKFGSLIRKPALKIMGSSKPARDKTSKSIPASKSVIHKYAVRNRIRFAQKKAKKSLRTTKLSWQKHSVSEKRVKFPVCKVDDKIPEGYEGYIRNKFGNLQKKPGCKPFSSSDNECKSPANQILEEQTADNVKSEKQRTQSTSASFKDDFAESSLQKSPLVSPSPQDIEHSPNHADREEQVSDTVSEDCKEIPEGYIKNRFGKIQRKPGRKPCTSTMLCLKEKYYSSLGFNTLEVDKEEDQMLPTKSSTEKDEVSGKDNIDPVIAKDCNEILNGDIVNKKYGYLQRKPGPKTNTLTSKMVVPPNNSPLIVHSTLDIQLSPQMKSSAEKSFCNESPNPSEGEMQMSDVESEDSSEIPKGHIRNKSGDVEKKTGWKTCMSPTNGKVISPLKKSWLKVKLSPRNKSLTKHSTKMNASSEQTSGSGVDELEQIPEGYIRNKFGKIQKKPGPLKCTSPQDTTLESPSTVDENQEVPEGYIRNKFGKIQKKPGPPKCMSPRGTPSELPPVMDENQEVPEGYIRNKFGKIQKKPGPSKCASPQGSPFKSPSEENQSVPEGYIRNKFGKIQEKSGPSKCASPQGSPSKSPPEENMLVPEGYIRTKKVKLLKKTGPLKCSSPQGSTSESPLVVDDNQEVPEGCIRNKFGKIQKKPGPPKCMSPQGTASESQSEENRLIPEGYNINKKGKLVKKPGSNSHTMLKVAWKDKKKTFLQGKQNSLIAKKKSHLKTEKRVTSKMSKPSSSESKQPENHEGIPDGYIRNKHGKLMKKPGPKIITDSSVASKKKEPSSKSSPVSTSKPRVKRKQSEVSDGIAHKRSKRYSPGTCSLVHGRLVELENGETVFVMNKDLDNDNNLITLFRNSEGQLVRKPGPSPGSNGKSLPSNKSPHPSQNQKKQLPQPESKSDRKNPSGKVGKKKAGQQSHIASEELSEIPEGYIKNKFGKLQKKPGRKSSKNSEIFTKESTGDPEIYIDHGDEDPEIYIDLDSEPNTDFHSMIDQSGEVTIASEVISNISANPNILPNSKSFMIVKNKCDRDIVQSYPAIDQDSKSEPGPSYVSSTDLPSQIWEQTVYNGANHQNVLGSQAFPKESVDKINVSAVDWKGSNLLQEMNKQPISCDSLEVNSSDVEIITEESFNKTNELVKIKTDYHSSLSSNIDAHAEIERPDDELAMFYQEKTSLAHNLPLIQSVFSCADPSSSPVIIID